MNIQETLLASLNEAQKKVVSAPKTHLLVLAGAGSGKTRVLVYRIVWLTTFENVSPHNILAVTFTNKAAGEMRHRLKDLIDVPLAKMWVGTFHGLAHRLLRQHWKAANLPQTFQILDSDDQYRIIKRILTNLNLDETQWPPRKIQSFINQQKDEGLRSNQIIYKNDPYNKVYYQIYQAYEDVCTRNGVVDFAELLLKSYELFIKNPDILEHYQKRFQHILVDEFQDTNTMQYAWLKLLGGERNYLMVVGDDDQSIYGWRGARVENIQRFLKDFPNNQIIKLEQNYRSTCIILAASNALISHNDSRFEKKLWSDSGKGDLISLYGAFNDHDEACYIVDQIKQSLKKGLLPHENAILYRSTAQSLVLEKAFIHAQIPYRIYGGLRFFERAEIKDILAYLRLIVNRHEDQSFERIVNTPARGIGEQTMVILRTQARNFSISLWEASQQLLKQNQLAPRAAKALRIFLDLIDKMDSETEKLPLPELTEQIIQRSGLLLFFQKEKGERGQTRIENLEELVNDTRKFISEDNSVSILSNYLAHVALAAGEYQGDNLEDCVQLMTLHAAKGLEFSQVFLCGMEEGLFPHHMSKDEPGRLEEERRLCYVGMTRAMQKLYLTYAEIRFLHGTERIQKASRFISEIPKKYLNEVRLTKQIVRSTHLSAIKTNPQKKQGTIGNTKLYLGQIVVHPTFGEGIITDADGRGENTRLQINFNKTGTKWLIASLAKLTTHN